MRHYACVHLVVPPGGSFRETRRIELGARVLTIGRAETCDIRVDVPGVDDEHAKISEVALIAVGPDCAVGDVPLDPGSRRLVMPGDEIQIGAVVLGLEGVDPSLLANDGAGNPQAVPLGPRVRVVEGAAFGDELVLAEENREYVIGRSPKCDLILSEDREVSREHVKLVRRGWRVYLQDQSSTRGSWLGRAAVYSASTTEWMRPTMLKVGATVLSLELPEGVGRRAPPAMVMQPFTPPPRARPATPIATPQNMPNAAPAEALPAVEPPVPSKQRPAPVVQYFDGSNTSSSTASSSPPPGPSPAPHVPPMQIPTTPNMGMVPQPMPGAAPIGIAAPPMPGQPARRAWKKQGPTIGKASGLLLLALAGLAILGVLFVVFSLME